MSHTFTSRASRIEDRDTLAAFISDCTQGTMDAKWAAHVLTDIVTGPDALRELWRGDERVAVGVCIDNSENTGDAAELSIFGEPQAVEHLVPWAEERGRAAGRACLDAPIWPGTDLPAQAFESRGFYLAYLMYRMRRLASAPAPKTPRAQLPKGWHWRDVTLGEADIYRSTADQAFAGIPGAFTPPADVTRKLLAKANPRPMILCTADGDCPIAAFVRVELRSDGAGELAYLGRHPRYRGKGLGEHIVAKGLAKLEALGARDIGLEVAAVNAAGIALYEFFNFAKTSEMPVFRRPLPAGD